MTTFSQLVDKMILETRRPDLATEIRSYVVQTVRELHFEPTRNNAVLYASNLKELSLTASADDGETWTIPNVTNFQVMAAVRYDAICDVNGLPVYAKPRIPGRGLEVDPWRYYRASDYFVFGGYGGIGAPIKLAWYEYPRSLKYQPAASRSATWDEESGWSYASTVTTPEEEEAAREASTNWILMRWPMLVEEGTRAKVYKRNGDDQRARTSYSLYTQLREGLYVSETTTQDGVY